MDFRERVYRQYLATHLAEGRWAAAQRDQAMWNRYFRVNYLCHLPPDRRARILELGCGMGQFLEFLRLQGYENAAGVDRSDEAVNYCRARNLPAEKAEATAFLSSRADCYDALILNDLIEHMSKPEALALLDACRSALRPNGVILIKTVNAANPILGAHSLAIDLTHETVYSEESLAQLLRVAGFDSVQVFPMNIYIKPHHPLHLAARAFAALINWLWRLLFRLYGRPTTRLFSKNILAVGKKI
ncbi:MAG: class I SAM-dependent methyltransferase [Candidatus Sumerlaeia bacterium]|nr:class I SAM-dependent methyltransferase [Candidatus Sumerlaeia bacterium]